MAKKTIPAEKTDVNKKLVKMGDDVVNIINRGKNPSIDIPLRSLSNVEWNEKEKLLTLGDKKSKRYFVNIGHARKFMQTMIVTDQCRKILDEKVHISIRDLYYTVKRTLAGTKENTFEDQRESDPILEDIEVTLDVLREELNLQANRRGFMVGNIKIVDAGDKIDARKLGSGGWAIPSNIEPDMIQFDECKADYVLVVEKNAVGDRLNEDKFWKKQNCILITAQGQATRGVRRLIHRLNTEAKLPVYVFTDADAYGYYIYSVIKQGSINLAFMSQKIAVPNSRFIGLTISDVERFGLQEQTIRCNDLDIKRTKELMAYQWFQNKEWQNELKLMIKKGYKAEQEALSAKKIKFVSEEYLPAKIEEEDFLP